MKVLTGFAYYGQPIRSNITCEGTIMATDWLKKLRTENFPSQTALALAAGIKPARYSRIEHGYCDMREEEIEGLAKALKLTVDEVRRGQPGVTKPEATKAKLPKDVSAASVAEVPPPKQPTVPPPSSPNPSTPPTETKPGDNLDDPKNFSLMPPLELLSPRDPNDAGVRSQLQKATVFAEKVLHTSKVRPAVWVAWRDFGRDAQTLLRGPAPLAAPTEPQPIIKIQPLAPKPLPISPSIAKTPAAKSSPRLHGNKNVFGHFVDVAREWLPAATSAALNAKALAAKTSHPEMGFMKHFKRIAEIELPRAEFDRIDREASRRDGSGA
jgi:transcriptional regulator with XRE-family HTH domain